MLYGARGIGAGLGPIALRWLMGQTPTTMRRSIGPAYFIVGSFYVALAAAGTLPLAAVCVLLAHFGGSILWVFSTVLLQMEVPDEFRGRVFAAELALVTLTSSIPSWMTGYALDGLGMVTAHARLRARRRVRRARPAVADDECALVARRRISRHRTSRTPAKRKCWKEGLGSKNC